MLCIVIMLPFVVNIPCILQNAFSPPLFLFSNVKLYAEYSQVEIEDRRLQCLMEDGVEDHFITFPLCLCFVELLSQLIGLIDNKDMIL